MSLTSLWADLSIHLVLVFATTNDSSTLTESTQAHLIPWKCYVKPDIPDYVCPSTSSTLGTFAVVSVLVAIFNIIIGYGMVVNFFTCGIFGREDSRGTWLFICLLPLCLNLGANALIAYIYHLTPGFGQGFGIGELTLCGAES